MKSLADRIEQYLKVLIERSDRKTLEVQRTELAETFGCAPSQITYVLATRFTREEGFITESRRGGKGYVRIRRVDRETVPNAGVCSQEEAFARLEVLLKRGLLSRREVELLKCVMSQKVLGPMGLETDFLRAKMLHAVCELLNV